MCFHKNFSEFHKSFLSFTRLFLSFTRLYCVDVDESAQSGNQQEDMRNLSGAFAHLDVQPAHTDNDDTDEEMRDTGGARAADDRDDDAHMELEMTTCTCVM